MAEQVPTSSFCEVCGIDIIPDIELKRFGKFFCSKEHMEQYVRTRQKDLGLTGEKGEQEDRYGGRRGWFRGC